MVEQQIGSKIFMQMIWIESRARERVSKKGRDVRVSDVPFNFSFLYSLLLFLCYPKKKKIKQTRRQQQQQQKNSFPFQWIAFTVCIQLVQVARTFCFELLTECVFQWIPFRIMGIYVFYLYTMCNYFDDNWSWVRESKRKRVEKTGCNTHTVALRIHIPTEKRSYVLLLFFLPGRWTTSTTKTTTTTLAMMTVCMCAQEGKWI